MQSQNNYIGDDKFKKLLEHYNCPTSVEVIKMKFLGAICSPNLELRPTDVISSFWEQGKEPRLETKDEADLFFKFFMGLWDEMFTLMKENKVKFGKSKYKTKEEFLTLCEQRFQEIELGFVEGFWGGKDDLDIPSYLAELIDSLTSLAEVYVTLAKKVSKLENMDKKVQDSFEHTDSMVLKGISFIIENSVHPRIEEISRTVN
ncbi:MAG: hypothetical protein ACK5N8_06555 [Alphaproteobacteria bacterium]